MKSSNQNKLTFPKLIALVGALLMVACLFLSYGKAIDDHAENLKENIDKVVYEELNITAGDMLNVSMIDYAKMYLALSEQVFGHASAGILYVVFVALIGGFAVIAALFAVGRKPIAVIIFSAMSYGVFSLQNWDFADRGVIPGKNYGWGLGHHLFYVAAVIVFAGAIWMLVEKIKIKKVAKLAQQG